jgi:hypothetical protein
MAASILLFAGNAHAVITAGLSIENEVDSNGNTTVIKGSDVDVAYAVSEDTDNAESRRRTRNGSGDPLRRAATVRAADARLAVTVGKG